MGHIRLQECDRIHAIAHNLHALGIQVDEKDDAVTIYPGTPGAAAIAPFADGAITITGIGHIRLQECDRIHAIAHNLHALGIQVEEKDDAVTIYPGTPGATAIDTFEDHRVAMSFALTGLRCEGVVVKDPFCCKKTFAEYFDVLEKVLAEVTEETDA
ncbi:MAG: hypothetical protein J6P60_05435 [Lachnospiraceae bacterium]|nr:hypothetical protein [Lachnospiraceae bacterium]